MNRLIYLLILLVFFNFPVVSQTPYWEENFNTNTGWDLEENWVISSGFLRFNWSPVVMNYDMSATSPKILLNDDVEDLIISHYVESYEWSATTEMAEISIIFNEQEEVIWSHALIDGNWGLPTGSEIVFPLSEYAGEEIQVKFRSYGPTTDAWYWWDVFSIKLTCIFDYDLSVQSISGPNNLEINQSGTWTVNVKNLGLNLQTDFSLELFNYKTGEQLGSKFITDDLTNGQSESYIFYWTADTLQNTGIYCKMTPAEDDFEDNNTSGSQFLRINPDFDYSVLIWDNDNEIETIIDPEQGDYIQGHTGVTRAFDAAGIDYTLAYSLPIDLYEYDMIFVSMGCYCLS